MFKTEADVADYLKINMHDLRVLGSPVTEVGRFDQLYSKIPEFQQWKENFRNDYSHIGF